MGVENLSSRLIDKQELTLINECICGCRDFAPCKGRNRIPTMMCARCGVLIQMVNMDPDQLGKWYRDVYQGKIYGANANRLAKNTHRDRIAGTPFHRYIRCRVEPE